MKMFLALVTCLALVSVAYAEPQNKKGKGKHKEEGAQGPSQGNKPAKIKGAGGGNRQFRKGSSGIKKIPSGVHQGPTGISQSNAGAGGGQHMKSKKMSKHGGAKQFQAADSNLPAVQKGGKLQGKHQGKHQFKKFQLANKANPNIPNVKFKMGNQIQGAHKWKGQKYFAFKNYKAQWHDKGWWHHHHNKVVFVLGGWYFWNAGYYYPAWGYAPDSYYAYDGPIYTGSVDRDPGEVVANVQAALQEQGYYVGEIDGVLGPLTRAALAQYQQAQGVEPTGAIDEPTLESLGMV